MSVFVLSREGKPVMPCTEKRTRKLLESGRARVHRMFPFAIRLVDRTLDSCVHVGRVAVRRTGSFNMQTVSGVVQGISHKHCKALARADGYGYHLTAQTTKESGDCDDAKLRALSLPAMNDRVSRAS